MHNYELLYVVNEKMDSEAVKAVVERYKSLVSQFGEPTVEEWGMRNLAYAIKDKTTGKHSKGYYVLMKFTAPTDFPVEIERQMRISDDILRYMTERV